MSRSLFNAWLTDDEGDLVPFGHITMLEADGVTPLAAPMYAVPVGGAPFATTELVANALGYVEAYTDAPQACAFTPTGGQQVQSGFWDRNPLTSTQTLTNKTLISPTMSDVLLKGPMHDVRAYGAVPATGINGSTGKWEGADAQPGFLAAHAAAVADGGWVYFSGVFMWNSPINWNPNVPLVGVNDSGSRIMPDTGCNGLPVIEVCGVQQGHATWLNFGIGDIAMPGRPSCPFVFAEISAHVNSSSEHFLSRIKTDGYYTRGGAVFLAFASSTILDCIFHNNHNEGGIPAVRMDTMGESGVTSAFGYTYHVGSPVSDLNIIGTEIHDSSEEPDQYAILLNGVQDITFVKGIIGGTGTGLVGMKNSVRGLLFLGTFFYSTDSGISASTTFYQLQAGVVTSLHVVGGNSAINVAVLGGAQGCTYASVSIKGHTVDDGTGVGSPIMVLLSGTGGTITGADIDCQGLAVNVGASGVIAGDLYNPGAITAGSRSLRVYDNDGGLTAFSFKTGLAPATVGVIRLSNNDVMTGRNVLNSADVLLLAWDTSNTLNLGSTSGMAETNLRSTTGSKFDVAGTVRVHANTTGLGFNAATPIAQPALGAAGSDPATTQALANAIRTALINYGLATA